MPRFSVERHDRAYDPSHAKRIKFIKVDGNVVNMPLTADTDEGMVRHIATNPDGSPVISKGEATILESRGRVEIEFLDDATRWDKSRSGGARVGVARASNGDLLVQVYSVARPGAIKQLRKEFLTLPSTDLGLCQAAGVMAGGAAELLCSQYGDRLDPSECARVAVEQCYRMLKDNPDAATGHDVYDKMDIG